MPKMQKGTVTMLNSELAKWRVAARKFRTSSLLISSKIRVHLANLEARSTVDQMNSIQSETGMLLFNY